MDQSIETHEMPVSVEEGGPAGLIPNIRLQAMSRTHFLVRICISIRCSTNGYKIINIEAYKRSLLLRCLHSHIFLLYILLSSLAARNIRYVSQQRALQQAEKHIDLPVGVS